jgi:hypothetical protein
MNKHRAVERMGGVEITHKAIYTDVVNYTPRPL